MDLKYSKIHDDLRTIRIMIEAIRKQASGHTYRNRMLDALRREVMVLATRQAGFRNDHHLRHSTEVREQLTDGLRAMAVLLHDGGQADWDGELELHRGFETHREVNNRLLLAYELTSFLIGKAEEQLPPSDEEEYPEDYDDGLGNLDGLVIATAGDKGITVTVRPMTDDLWGEALDEIEQTPGNDTPDDEAALE